jgi:hypothetical protein
MAANNVPLLTVAGNGLCTVQKLIVTPGTLTTGSLTSRAGETITTGGLTVTKGDGTLASTGLSSV